MARRFAPTGLPRIVVHSGSPVAQPRDGLRAVRLPAQPIAFLTQPVPFAAELLDVSLRLVPFPSQPLDFLLLPLSFGDQIVTRVPTPARSPAFVMPRVISEYKPKVTRSRRSVIIAGIRTREINPTAFR